jgi:hypothetical protein
MRLKAKLLVLSLALFLAAPAAATTPPWASVSTLPAAPVPGDGIVLVLSGEWTDTCVPTSSLASLHQDGFGLRVHLNYAGFSGACGAAVTPWLLAVDAGVLAEGTYTVEVTVGRSFLPDETIGTGSFTIVAPPVTRLWIPAFAAQSDGYTLASNLTAFNTANSTAVVTPLSSYDAFGERPPSTDPVQIAPGAAALVPTQSLRPGQAVEMLELSAPGRLAFRATLERLELVPEGQPKVPESLGRVELPIFTSLFPAGHDRRRGRRLSHSHRVCERSRGAATHQPHPLQLRVRTGDVSPSSERPSAPVREVAPTP